MEGIESARRDGFVDAIGRYQYRPLISPNDIRLLRISPSTNVKAVGEGDDPLEFELIHVDLNPDPVPEFHAISYAWGDVSHLRPLALVDDQYLEISASLHMAIHETYRVFGKKVMYIWADQACIDQRNMTERNEQIKLMGNVFQYAIRTVVWLGEADDSTRAAWRFMNLLARCKLELDKTRDLFYKGDRKRLMDLIDIWRPSPDDIETWTDALIRLSERPWFSRLWTFQEFVVAARLEFVCGPHSCTRHDILRSFFVTRTLRDPRTAGMHHAGCLDRYRERWRRGHRRPLLRLLSDVNDSAYRCAEPHDRVYALLSLHTDPVSIPVDYSMPVPDLLCHTARSILRNDRSLHALARHRLPRSSQPSSCSLPSWVPDWTRPTRPWTWSLDDRRTDFSASAGRAYAFSEPRPGLLEVRGRAFARILEVLPHPFPEDFSPEREAAGAGAAAGGDFLHRVLGTHSLIPALHSRLEPILSQRRGGGGEEEVRERVRWVLGMTVTCGRFGEGKEEDGGSVSLADSLVAKGGTVVRAVQKCKGRRVAVLDHGDAPVGLVPGYAREGDWVCVLEGGVTPLVLRGGGDGDGDGDGDGGCYENLGECYVCGIMYGEAVDWEEGEGEVFWIR